MFKRLAYSLFKPKHIALFIKDKSYMSIIYFFIAVICCALPSICRYVNTDYSITESSFRSAVNTLVEYKESNAKIVDSLFTCDSPFVITIDENKYYFGNQVVSDTTYFYFSEDSFKLVENSRTSDSITYTDLGYTNLDFTVLDTNSLEFGTFKGMMNTIYYRYLRYSDSVIVLSQFFTTFVDVGFSILIIFLFVSAITPMFKSSYRFNLAVYSMTWFYVIYIIGSLLNSVILEFVGIIIAFFFIRKALSSVRIINIKK